MEEECLSWELFEVDSLLGLGVPFLLKFFLLLLPFLGESEELKPEDEQEDDRTLIFIIFGF